MAVSLLFDNVMESFTTTGTGTVTLLGAETGSQSFAVVGNLNTTVTTAWAVDANDNPSGAWEVAIGCTYTVSGTTMSRGTLLGSSTGSVISWAAGKKRIAQGIPALLFNQSYLGTKGAIQGLGLAYNSATVLRMLAGTCAINNKVLSLAQTDYTSGSTMKDLANATVTLGASKRYSAFAVDNAGTLEIRFQNMNGSGSGNTPDFSTTYDYWESVNGPAERRIGSFWTDGSGNIIQFTFVNYGRYRRIIFPFNTIQILSGGTSGSYASLTITPYIQGDDADYDVSDASGGATIYTGHAISVDGGANDYNTTISTPDAANHNSWLNRITVPNTQDLRYKVFGTALDAMTLYLNGVGQFV